MILQTFPNGSILSEEYLPSRGCFESAINSWEETKNLLRTKYWSDWKVSIPNVFNVDHMTLFCFLLAKEEINLKREMSADRICYLNLIRHSTNIWHSVSLPKKTLFVHALGTVLGKAKYGSSLVCYQNVTVGGSNSVYPIIHGDCVIYSGASILGNSEIGENVVIGAGSLIVDEIIPSNSKVQGRSPNLIIKSLEVNISEEFFYNTHTDH